MAAEDLLDDAKQRLLARKATIISRYDANLWTITYVVA